MSHFAKITVKMTNKEAIASALSALFSGVKVEVFDTPQDVRGYSGTSSGKTAHIIARIHTRENWQADFGVQLMDNGECVLHYDVFNNVTLYAKEWQDQLKQEYSLACITQEAEARGQDIEVVRSPDRKIHVYVRC